MPDEKTGARTDRLGGTSHFSRFQRSCRAGYFVGRRTGCFKFLNQFSCLQRELVEPRGIERGISERLRSSPIVSKIAVLISDLLAIIRLDRRSSVSRDRIRFLPYQTQNVG